MCAAPCRALRRTRSDGWAGRTSWSRSCRCQRGPGLPRAQFSRFLLARRSGCTGVAGERPGARHAVSRAHRQLFHWADTGNDELELRELAKTYAAKSGQCRVIATRSASTARLRHASRPSAAAKIHALQLIAGLEEPTAARCCSTGAKGLGPGASVACLSGYTCFRG